MALITQVYGFWKLDLLAVCYASITAGSALGREWNWLTIYCSIDHHTVCVLLDRLLFFTVILHKVIIHDDVRFQLTVSQYNLVIDDLCFSGIICFWWKFIGPRITPTQPKSRKVKISGFYVRTFLVWASPTLRAPHLPKKKNFRLMDGQRLRKFLEKRLINSENRIFWPLSCGFL